MPTRSFLTFVAGVALALAIPAMGQTVTANFPDVSANASFSAAVNAMVNLGVIRGYDNGRFGPNDTVTRAQVAVMFDRYDKTVVEPLRTQIATINAKLGIETGGQLCTGNHVVGDTYKSTDGCNSCSCTLNGEICTLRACASSSRSSVSSAPVCGNGKCESGEATSCPISCAPGMACPQYCLAGTCQRDCMASSASSSSSNQCSPYVCKDGTSIPSCTSDGHVINYFVAPCYTHGGEVGQ